MKLQGIIPPTTTPFDERGEILFDAVATQVEWLINQGAHGVAVGGSTGEGHTITASEFPRLIESAVAGAQGRVPVVAGIITDSTRESIARGQSIGHLDVAALQVTPVHYLFRPSDDAMVDHFRALAGETGKPIIIYNVVPWTYLSPELLIRIMSEVPEVVGVKQSAGDLKLFADLMADVMPDKLIFSAVDALMYPAYMLGAHGAIAARSLSPVFPALLVCFYSYPILQSRTNTLIHTRQMPVLGISSMPHPPSPPRPGGKRSAHHAMGIGLSFASMRRGSKTSSMRRSSDLSRPSPTCA